MNQLLSERELWSLVDRDAPELEEYLGRHPAERQRVEQLRGMLGRLTPVDAPALARGLPERIGPYRIERLLGEGGMGVVFEAFQESPPRPVAVKVVRGAVDDRAAELFERETRALARLVHPGIARIYAADTFEGEPYFAMELVRGLPLHRHVEAAHSSRAERLQLFVRVCAAVQHAHEQRVIHRDLKPTNVLVDPDAGPKILDFGLARILDAERSLTLTASASGQILGTLAYMSPEQVRGKSAHSGARVDVYSLGVMLYELLTGRLPHELAGMSLAQVVREICERAPKRPSAHVRTLRGDLDMIVLKAMHKDPALRYASARELAEDVERHLVHEPIRATPPSLGYRVRKFSRRHWLGLASSSAIVLLLLSVAFFATFRVGVFNTITGQWWATKTPYAELRWEGDTPQVAIAGEWYELLAIDGLETAYVIGHCKQGAGLGGWRKRFSEDLLEVINRLGVFAVWSVELELRRLSDGQLVRVTRPLRHDWRREVHSDRYDMPLSRVHDEDGVLTTTFDGATWELVSFDGASAAELAETLSRAERRRGPQYILYDLVTDTTGRSPGRVVDFELRDPISGQLRRFQSYER